MQVYSNIGRPNIGAVYYSIYNNFFTYNVFNLYPCFHFLVNVHPCPSPYPCHCPCSCSFPCPSSCLYPCRCPCGMKIDMYNMDMAIDMGIHALYKTPVQRFGSRLWISIKISIRYLKLCWTPLFLSPKNWRFQYHASLISFITDIGLSVDLQYDHVYPSYCGELATPLVTV